MKRLKWAMALLSLAFTSAGIANADTAINAPVYPAMAEQKVSLGSERIEITNSDRETIRFVVQMHIASLSQQRPDLFSKTFTKKTQEAFESSAHMLAFFSIRYVPVRFGKAFEFDSLSLRGKVPVQHGYLVDKTGRQWRVSYGMRHMGNGDWRIISTIIKPAPGDPT